MKKPKRQASRFFSVLKPIYDKVTEETYVPGEAELFDLIEALSESLRKDRTRFLVYIKDVQDSDCAVNNPAICVGYLTNNYVLCYVFIAKDEEGFYLDYEFEYKAMNMTAKSLKELESFLLDSIPYEAVQHCLIVYKEQETWISNFVENTFRIHSQD